MAAIPFNPNRPPIDWDEAFRLREQEHWTFAEIAREFGYAYKTVRTELTKRGAKGRQAARRGIAGLKLRELWRYTHEKCERPDHPSYSRNGGEGVSVSADWDTFEAFYEWARDSGYRVGLRLARKSDFGPYAPWNCHWITPEECHRTRRMPKGRSRRGQKLVPIDWDQAKRLYLDEGLPTPEVARRIGSSYTGVYLGLRRMGLMRPKPRALTGTQEKRRIHKTWSSIHARCTDPRSNMYPYAGARGIKVAKEWESFEPFLRWAIDSGAKRGLCISLIDRSGDYSPSNCKWVTKQEVVLRRRSPKHAPAPRRPVTAFGETKSMNAWTRDRRCKVTVPTISARLARGWTAEQAISGERENRGGSDIVAVEIRAFGQVKSLTGWLRDKRCRVTLTGVTDRIRRGWSTEDAISTPPFTLPVSKRARKRRSTRRA